MCVCVCVCVCVYLKMLPFQPEEIEITGGWLGNYTGNTYLHNWYSEISPQLLLYSYVYYFFGGATLMAYGSPQARVKLELHLPAYTTATATPAEPHL